VSPICPVQVFDFRGEAVALDQHEWRRGIVARERVGVCAHQWGVEVTTTPENRARFGEAEALARRALGAPYHLAAGVTRHGEPVVAVVHPAARYTHHGDAANRGYLGLAVMGLFPEVEAARGSRHRPALAERPELAVALLAAVARAVELAVAMLGEQEGRAGVGPWSLITHRQSQNEARDGKDADPGEWIVQAILASPPAAQGLLVAEPDLVLAAPASKPWPASWRGHLPPPIAARAEPARRDYEGPIDVPVVGDAQAAREPLGGAE
jgi:hypothetical protein